jgi:hypothetical protein
VHCVSVYAQLHLMLIAAVMLVVADLNHCYVNRMKRVTLHKHLVMMTKYVIHI